MSLKEKDTTSAPVMADYYKVGPVDGNKPASQWLARLAYESRRVGNDGTPEDFFEAVEILFEDDAALWLNSSSRYRRMVDSIGKATKEDMEEFKIAFQAEFPARSLSPRDEGNVSLSLLAPIEAVVLSNIVAAFLGGLTDDDIRSAVLARPNILSDCLQGAYNAAEKARTTIEKICSMERTRAEKKELEIFRNHYRQRYQRPLSAARPQRQVLMLPPQQPRNFFLNKPPSSHKHAIQEHLNPNRGIQAQAVQRSMQNNGAERSHYAGRSDVAGARGGLENTPPRHLSRNPFVNGARKANSVAGSEVLLGSVESLLKRNTEKAFRVPVVVKTIRNGKPVRVSLPMRVAQADQGSDMIIVTMGLLRKLGLSVKSLAERGFGGLTMNVADGISSRLTHYSEYEIRVCGIWRKIEAFVRPSWEKNADEIHLLLGLPWLHSVDARIEIRDSKFEIGDRARGECVETIQGPKFIESGQYKLVLNPVNFEAKEIRKEVESSGDESEDQDSEDLKDDDDDIESSDEDWSGIFNEKEMGK
ncbi:hypothetical protein OnM2_074041 [Erysiphe neolycopersici]|uniref:Uncharacterized protein n=1 Tax=Erysiphe neolycopersici TaxID=212602 RepID=A0A420HJ46_9PEZI|nr:hypothetical protein OnM2_074041 [Erysiphe neolycopersici]